MEDKNTAELLKVLHNYAVPDPKIVGKLPKGGTSLDFVGHADITRILIEIDPHWRLVPIAWENGRPAVNIVNDMATMWFEMTLLGQARLAIGTAKANSMDLDKVLYGDALRNGAMRFGIGLSLWTKQEWNDLDHYQQAPLEKVKGYDNSVKYAEPKPAAKPAGKASPTKELSEEQIAQFKAACDNVGLNIVDVIAHAGIDANRPLIEADLAGLRASFKEMKGA
jgi:hypothetical protein